ncbi:hypothetical protein GALL_325590 [mine drainage metagenome]|uniref:Uncharacterized protein n=1 Tax=mine drainage metagenome TaxID=410659 RepID=A0A1J5QPP4_9ZZZZ
MAINVINETATSGISGYAGRPDLAPGGATTPEAGGAPVQPSALALPDADGDGSAQGSTDQAIQDAMTSQQATSSSLSAISQVQKGNTQLLKLLAG